MGLRQALACAVLLLALPACLAPLARPQEPVTEATLGRGAVHLSAPRGYCIDAGSLRRLAGGGDFALLAPCTQLTDSHGFAAAPALMTVSVMPQGADAAAPDAARLVAAVAPAPVGAHGQGAETAYAQVMQGGELALPGGDPRHWRGAKAVAGHLTSLALYAPEGSALAGRDGRLLLGDLAAGLSAHPARRVADATKTPRGGFFATLFPASD